MALTKEDLAEIGKILQPIKEHTEELRENFKELKKTTEELRQTTAELKRDTKELKQTTIENETNRNIMRVAEGHVDLSRKLFAALKFDAEREMLSVRVNILEDEARKIKAHMAFA